MKPLDMSLNKSHIGKLRIELFGPSIAEYRGTVFVNDTYTAQKHVLSNTGRGYRAWVFRVHDASRMSRLTDKDLGFIQ